MSPDTLVDELAAAKRLPRQALLRAAEDPEVVAPAVLALLDKAAGGGVVDDAEANLLFYGLHVLGAARDRRALAPLLRLLRRPVDEVEWLLGDASTQTLPRLVISLFDGVTDDLLAVLADRNVDGFTRWSLFEALAYLTWEGRIDRDETVRFLKRFDDERLADDEDVAWYGWQQAIAQLGLRELAPRVEAALAEDRLPTELAEPEQFRADLARAEAAPEDPARFTEENAGYIDDVVEILEWTDFEEQEPDPDDLDFPFPAVAQPVRNPMRHVGRNDPCPCGSGKKAKRCCLQG